VKQIIRESVNRVEPGWDDDLPYGKADRYDAGVRLLQLVKAGYLQLEQKKE
jgi:hypothetical protein